MDVREKVYHDNHGHLKHVCRLLLQGRVVNVLLHTALCERLFCLSDRDVAAFT